MISCLAICVMDPAALCMAMNAVASGGAGIKAKLENGELTITIPKLDSPILPEARPCPRACQASVHVRVTTAEHGPLLMTGAEHGASLHAGPGSPGGVAATARVLSSEA